MLLFGRDHHNSTQMCHPLGEQPYSGRIDTVVVGYEYERFVIGYFSSQRIF